MIQAGADEETAATMRRLQDDFAGLIEIIDLYARGFC